MGDCFGMCALPNLIIHPHCNSDTELPGRSKTPNKATHPPKITIHAMNNFLKKREGTRKKAPNPLATPKHIPSKSKMSNAWREQKKKKKKKKKKKSKEKSPTQRGRVRRKVEHVEVCEV
jgi:hypothetical protein